MTAMTVIEIPRDLQDNLVAYVKKILQELGFATFNIMDFRNLYEPEERIVIKANGISGFSDLPLFERAKLLCSLHRQFASQMINNPLVKDINLEGCCRHDLAIQYMSTDINHYPGWGYIDEGVVSVDCSWYDQEYTHTYYDFSIDYDIVGVDTDEEDTARFWMSIPTRLISV